MKKRRIQKRYLLAVLTAAFVAFMIYIAIPGSDIYTISPETTRVTDLCTAEGFVDYLPAIHDEIMNGVSSQDNLAIALASVFYSDLSTDHFRSDSKISDIHRPFLTSPWTTQKDQSLWVDFKKVDFDVCTMMVFIELRNRFAESALDPDRVRLPGDCFTIDPTLKDSCILLGEFLCYRAMNHLGEKRYLDAWIDLHACHRLGRLLQTGARTMDWVAGAKIEELAYEAQIAFFKHAQIDSALKDRIANNVASLPPRQHFVNKIDRIERLVVLDLLTRLYRDSCVNPRSFRKQPGQSLGMAIDIDYRGIDWDEAMRTIHATYDRFLDIGNTADTVERDAQLDGFLKTIQDKETQNLQGQFFKMIGDKQLQGRTIARRLLHVMFIGIDKLFERYDRLLKLEAELAKRLY
jgi:hypothetical protein